MPSPDLDATQPLPVLPQRDLVEPYSAGIPDQAPPAPAGPTRRGPVLGRLGRLLVLLALAATGVVAAALLVTPPRQALLILGSDARPDELRRGEVGRTDTLMVLFADRATPRLATVSVPRDLWVDIPGHGQERVNAAYELGGGQTAKQTVSNILGQRIDRFAVVGLQGVRDIVDAAGGIDITVDQPIHDAAYPTDDYGYTTIDIPAGPQHMDGETALEYARTRHQDDDFAREARQQRVVGALRQRLLSPLNWWRLPGVLLASQKAITTDLGPFDAIALGAAVLRNPGGPDRLAIDTSLTTEFTGQGGAYLLQAKPELRPAVARFLGSSSTTASQRVDVLNAAGVAGLARSTADRLAQRGFDIVNVGDAARPQAQTTVQARPDARRAADDIASLLRLPATRVSETTSLPPSVDIRVTVGPDLAAR